MYKVLVSDPISDTGIQALTDHPDFLVEKQTNLTPDQLKSIIGEYDALIVRSQTTVTAEIIQAADRLKVIARAGVGVDNIDIQAATRKGVIVVNAPNGNTIAATEHTLAMMLSLARQIPHAYISMTEGKWDRKTFKGVELFEKTLGVIGTGRIGTEVAKRAKSFEMNILAYDPYLTEEKAQKLGFTKASLDEIAEQADFITVHTPLTKETKGLIDANYLSKTKPGVRIVNCARGGIIDEAALAEAVKSGHVAGAALDVFEHEPLDNETFRHHPNIIVTPHLGASTAEAQEKVAQSVSEEIIDIFTSQNIQHAINVPRMSAEVQQKMKPYLELGDQIAQLVIQLFKKAPDKITVDYYGDLIEEDTGLLTRTLIKGILSYHLSDSVNIINVLQLLKEQGLTYTVQKNASRHGFANYMSLTLHHGSETATIGATVLNGFGGRIVNINDYRIDLIPERYMLSIRHFDVPGMIGRVGSILGENGVNIGNMQVGRKAVGGEAIMMLTVDKPVDNQVIDKLLTLPDLEHVQLVEIKDDETSNHTEEAVH
ncbi:phosphoglycerate dehydrogenase [Terrilactibacillus laevilacticus]|uniref:D-3-phosphoglycerate dehydrogenase n=1 Tax=Terrilactibacillus laevilacticus TaxID=1380157 RepID=A0ABW5PSF2_9BACI|nr:phosphoglycerate dehydrogenase [Terrilactibacillus laevilacticus]